MKSAHALSLLMIGAVVFAIGCNGGSSEGETKTGASTSSTTPPATTVAFSDVQGVLNAKCTGCHGGANPKDGVDLTGYAGVSKIVTPGDPANSKLIEVMKGDHGKKRMPPMGEPVPADQIQKVSDWIQGGAKES